MDHIKKVITWAKANKKISIAIVIVVLGYNKMKIGENYGPYKKSNNMG